MKQVLLEQGDWGNWYVVVEDYTGVGSSVTTQGFQDDYEGAKSLYEHLKRVYN